MAKEAEELGNVKEITPSEFFCGCGNCPSVFEAGDGTLFVIGKTVGDDIPDVVKRKVGADEYVVRVPAGLIKDLQFPD